MNKKDILSQTKSAKSKDDLEQLKLKAEIRDILSSNVLKAKNLLPILASLGTIGTIAFAIWTGYVDFENKTIGFNNKLDSAQSHYEDEIEKYKGSIDELQGDLVDLENQKDSLVESNARISESYFNRITLRRIEDRVNYITSNSYHSRFSQHDNVLSETIQLINSHSSIEELESIRRHAQDYITKTYGEGKYYWLEKSMLLLYVFYKGTGEQQYFQQFLDLAGNHIGDIPIESITIAASWNCDDLRVIAQTFLSWKRSGIEEISSFLKIQDIVLGYFMYYTINDCGDRGPFFQTSGNRFYITSHAYKKLTDITLPAEQKFTVLEAMRVLDPVGYIISISDLVVNAQLNDTLRSTLENYWPVPNTRVDYPAFASLSYKMQVPQNISIADWSEWRSNHSDHIKQWDERKEKPWPNRYF